MRRVAIDTNVFVAFKNSIASVVESLRHFDLIGIDVTVVAELYAGFALGNREKKNRSDLESFLDSPRVELLTHDLETAEYYATVFKRLKAKGAPIPTNDIWIAANAMKHGLALYSFDRHFDKVDGLVIHR
jgi:predicted nucleic acid-binding protein